MFKELCIISKGFRFGMLLQFAIGPVCIFIFQTASLRGFLSAEAGVMGVTLMDGIFITAAVLGIGSLMENRNLRTGLKLFGSFILFLFGTSIILNQLGIAFLPVFSFQSSGSTNSFVKALILTASSPLTIIFWAGVFSSKIAEGTMGKKEINFFGLGALISTIFFLSIISLLGTFIKSFLTADIIKLLNFSVGILLIYFSTRMLLKKV